MNLKLITHIYLYGRALCDYPSRPRVPPIDYEKYMDIVQQIKKTGYLDLITCNTCQTYFNEMYSRYTKWQKKCEEGSCTQYNSMMAHAGTLGWI
jgi:hypothetical protein